MHHIASLVRGKGTNGSGGASSRWGVRFEGGGGAVTGLGANGGEHELGGVGK